MDGNCALLTIAEIGTTSFLSTVAVRYGLILPRKFEFFIFRNQAEELREKVLHELA
jgi:hypothetical protein